jgi:membrane protease YdiL (CAAX protease family)
MGAFIQVLAFRIILFRLTEEMPGSWPALFIVAVLFGFFHFFNEDATSWPSITLILSDILLIATLYIQEELG